MLVVNLTPSSTASVSESCGVVGVVDALQALHGQLGGGGAAAVVKLHTTLAASALPAASFTPVAAAPHRRGVGLRGRQRCGGRERAVASARRS